MSHYLHSQHTFALLIDTFGRDPAGLVYSYFVTNTSNAMQLAYAGNYEACEDIAGAADCDYGLYGACYGGHRELAGLMIVRGTTNYNWGLRGACRGGHRELVGLMITLGATECACGKSISAHLDPP